MDPPLNAINMFVRVARAISTMYLFCGISDVYRYDFDAQRNTGNVTMNIKYTTNTMSLYFTCYWLATRNKIIPVPVV